MLADVSTYGWFGTGTMQSITTYGWFIGLYNRGIFVDMNGIFEEGIWF